MFSRGKLWIYTLLAIGFVSISFIAWLKYNRQNDEVHAPTTSQFPTQAEACPVNSGFTYCYARYDASQPRMLEERVYQHESGETIHVVYSTSADSAGKIVRYWGEYPRVKGAAKRQIKFDVALVSGSSKFDNDRAYFPDGKLRRYGNRLADNSYEIVEKYPDGVTNLTRVRYGERGAFISAEAFDTYGDLTYKYIPSSGSWEDPNQTVGYDTLHNVVNRTTAFDSYLADQLITNVFNDRGTKLETITRCNPRAGDACHEATEIEMKSGEMSVVILIPDSTHLSTKFTSESGDTVLEQTFVPTATNASGWLLATAHVYPVVGAKSHEDLKITFYPDGKTPMKVIVDDGTGSTVVDERDYRDDGTLDHETWTDDSGQPIKTVSHTVAEHVVLHLPDGDLDLPEFQLPPLAPFYTKVDAPQLPAVYIR